MADKLTEMFEAPTEPETPTQAALETPPAVAAPVPEPIKPAAEAPKVEPGFVPIAAVLDEREKRQRAERERDELRQAQTPQQIPIEPEAFALFMQEQTQRALTSARFDVSETLATEKHGEEAVKAAMDWGLQRAQESPAFAAEYLKQKNPIDWAVRQHKRDKLVSDMGDDPDAWVKKRYAELNPTTPAAPPNGALAPQAAPQPAPPRAAAPAPSLASAPSAGGLQTPVYQTPKAIEHLFGKE